MTKFWSLILIYALAVSSPAQQTSAPVQNITRVATAVNHMTVIEFHEPVTMVAAGSSDFQIERQENKVFVKPLKSGAASDLFVWTASRRFAYELETTEEVKNMNFAIDSLAPAAPPQPLASTATDELADMMLTRVFLDSEEIAGANRAEKNKVNVRIEQVFRTKSSVYVRYVIENKTKRPYHVPSPLAMALEPAEVAPAVPTLMRRQLDQRAVNELGTTRQSWLPVAHAESEAQDVVPGGSAKGVIVIREALASPVVVQIFFDNQVRATVVL
jgi:hypothetical protein